ncbi:MAG: hypothetical protein M1505_02390 [Patescibacteria group bacterium]|nr:hypothetical protein [Patescibacteria group bacterium]
MLMGLNRTAIRVIRSGGKVDEVKGIFYFDFTENKVIEMDQNGEVVEEFDPFDVVELDIEFLCIVSKR